MNGVLVDTSVWVDHFRKHNAALVDLLELDLVMTHPLVVGEIACGTPPERAQVLSDLGSLRQAQQAGIREVMDFIEHERLFGLGCGLVDLLLLASTLMTPGSELWTLDKRLGALAERFGVMHQPARHQPPPGGRPQSGPDNHSHARHNDGTSLFMLNRVMVSLCTGPDSTPSSAIWTRVNHTGSCPCLQARSRKPAIEP